jgi:ubiquinone/menaquinone biosynthesis C-methylase UbiE
MSDPRADALRAGYATVARAYREHLIDELDGKPLDRGFLDAFVASCEPGLIVDVGCGPGHVARYLAAHGATVEGLDLSPEMIDEARRSHPALAFRVGDMFALPYETGSVRGIVAFYAIVHLASTELLAPLREFQRVLAPGGLAVLAFHAGTETKRVDELFGCATSLDFIFHTPEAVMASLVGAGFVIEARLDRQPYPTLEYASQRTYLLARKTGNT